MSKSVLAVIYSLLTILIFFIDLKTELGVAGGVLYLSVIALCLPAKDKRFFLAFGFAGIVLTIAGYFLSPLGGEENKIFLNRLYAVFAIFITSILGFISASHQEQLEIISKNIAELVSFVDKDKRFQYVNKSYLDWFGIPREKILNEHIANVLGEHTYENLKSHINDALDGKPQDFEIQIPHGDKDNAYVKAQYFPKRDWSGKIEGFFAIITDLTTYKQNEALIEKENKRLVAILNSIPYQVWVLNEMGEIKFFNTACEDIVLQLGDSISGASFKGKNILDIYSDIWKKDDIEILQNHIKSKTAHFNFEYFLDFPTGRRHFLLLGKNIRLEGLDGKFVISHIDITQRKRAEEDVIQSKSQLEAILDNSPAVIYMKDMDGRYLMINKFCEKTLKINRKDIIGKTTHEVFPKDLADQFIKNDKKLINSLGPQEVEETIWDPTTGKRIFLSIQFLLKGKNGTPYAFCGISTEITQRKKDYNLLQRIKAGLEGEVKLNSLELLSKNEALIKEMERHKFTQEQLIHMEKLSALGKLTGTIAHEFNNPIYAIQLILEQLNDEVSFSDSQQKGLGIAIKECQRVSSLISKLKDFYLPSSGELKSTSFDVLIDETLLLLGVALKKNDIRLIRNLKNSSKKLFVIEDQIKQVLLNILKNSIESIPINSKNKQIEISTGYTMNEAWLSIKDSGVGIPNDIIDSISEPFVSTKISEKGSGLGLPISYRIIDEHAGRIEVTSKLGVGTDFKITLPVENAL